MDGPLDLQRLHDLCGSPLPDKGGNTRAGHVAAALGPLAPIWLKPEVLDRSHAWHCEMTGEEPSVRPHSETRVERGQIGILLATTLGRSLPLLRPAFVLPVEWRREAGSSPRLPLGLAEFAASVLDDVGIDGLSLHLSPSLEAAGVDFSGFRFSLDSAWAALAAGAIVVAQGGVTKPDVLVSAARMTGGDTFWIARVHEVEAKLDAASASGAAVVFLPQENEQDVTTWKISRSGGTLQIRHLSRESGAPRRILAKVLHAMEAPPTRAAGAEPAACREYYIRMPDEGHNEYYRDELLADVAAEMRPQMDGDSRLRDVDRLAIIASKSWSLGILLADLFDPDHVLVLHDGGLRTAVGKLSEALPSWKREGKAGRVVQEKECRPGEDLAADVAAALQAFAAGSGRIVIDLTAGSRSFHYAILSSLPSNAEVVFVLTTQDPRHARARPGTERLRRLMIPGR